MPIERRSRGWSPAILLCALWATALPLSAQPPAQDVDTLQAANLMVFTDDFNSATTYATYKPLNGSSVTIANGKLNVSIPDTATNAGLRIRFPPGSGIRCSSFGGLEIQEAPIGSYMRWTWWGYDDQTGKEVFLLETEITKTGSFTVRHRKADGTTVSHHVADKNWGDVKKKWWDTRRGGKQVMLEIEFKDGTKYRSGWIDPPASTLAGVDIASTVPEFSIDTTGGAEVHLAEGDTVPLPTEATRVPDGALPAFDNPIVTGLFPHWVFRLWDSDHVVHARVERLGTAVRLPGEDGLRLPVTYTVLESLRGHLASSQITVYHRVGAHPRPMFRAGNELLLILEREPFQDPSGRLVDAGSPPGVMRFSPGNRQALRARLGILNFGLEDDDANGQ